MRGRADAALTHVAFSLPCLTRVVLFHRATQHSSLKAERSLCLLLSVTQSRGQRRAPQAALHEGPLLYCMQILESTASVREAGWWGVGVGAALHSRLHTGRRVKGEKAPRNNKQATSSLWLNTHGENVQKMFCSSLHQGRHLV